MNKAMKAIRAHDIQPGLTGVNSGLINHYMKRTKVIGAAAQIATLIKGRNVVNLEGLEVAVGELGIDENLLEKALYELFEVGFVSVISSGGIIKKIEERVPLLTDIYEILGFRELYFAC